MHMFTINKRQTCMTGQNAWGQAYIKESSMFIFVIYPALFSISAIFCCSILKIYWFMATFYHIFFFQVYILQSLQWRMYHLNSIYQSMVLFKIFSLVQISSLLSLNNQNCLQEMCPKYPKQCLNGSELVYPGMTKERAHWNNDNTDWSHESTK